MRAPGGRSLSGVRPFAGRDGERQPGKYSEDQGEMGLRVQKATPRPVSASDRGVWVGSSSSCQGAPTRQDVWARTERDAESSSSGHRQ